MKLFFTTMAIVMTALLAVSIIGCGGDDDDGDGDAAVVATFSKATPASGGTIAANQDISIEFSGNPGDVTVSAGTVSTSGSKRTISPPDGNFAVGQLSIEITWSNGPDGGEGSETLTYTVEAADETAPAVASSNPENGAKDLDPAKVTEDGITVTFTEAVTGALMLMDGDNDVGWTSTTDGDTITLTGVAGKELSNETDYTVTGTVQDASGNEAEVSISFVTKAKE